MRVLLTTVVAITCLTGTAFAQQGTLSEAEQLQIAVQKICPVMGTELGSMGEPVKVQVGEQIAWLCCKGCQSNSQSRSRTSNRRQDCGCGFFVH